MFRRLLADHTFGPDYVDAVVNAFARANIAR